jgi:hypothetical protein
MSNDGTCLVVADAPANAAGFGRSGTQRGERAGAFPQVRLAGLAECGTHTLTAATIGRLHDRGDYTGQRSAARAGRGHTRAGRPQLSLWLCRPCLRVVHDRACRPWRREFDRNSPAWCPENSGLMCKG